MDKKLKCDSGIALHNLHNLQPYYSLMLMFILSLKSCIDVTEIVYGTGRNILSYTGKKLFDLYFSYFSIKQRKWTKEEE